MVYFCETRIITVLYVYLVLMEVVVGAAKVGGSGRPLLREGVQQGGWEGGE